MVGWTDTLIDQWTDVTSLEVSVGCRLARRSGVAPLEVRRLQKRQYQDRRCQRAAINLSRPARLAEIRSLYEGGATSSVGAPPWWKIRDFISSLRYGVMTTTNGQMDRQTDRQNLL